MADERFSALAHDPRYRLPSRKKARTTVDPRFKRLFSDQDFSKKSSVDRYGRKVQPESGKKALKKLYRLEDGDEDDGRAKKKAKRSRDRKQDDGASSTSGSEDEQVVEKRDPAREGGFSASSSEDESGSGDESVDEDELLAETAGQEQTEEIPEGEVTHRLAAVNLDWDNLRAVDIMAAASAFAPSGGKVKSVVIYPSEFGRTRMEQEDLNGPPRDIFARGGATKSGERESSSDGPDDEEEDEQIKRQLQQEQLDEGEEFDMPALRQYQLERLRYYYAVITCDSKITAKSLYDAMDKREYFTTSNYFDLRFIPDDTTFEDDPPREECTQVPMNYKPNEFRTDALSSSKVRLTWDDDDTTRKEVMRRAFSRAEMDENDLQAYIGSDTSDAESVTSRKSAAEERRAKRSEEQRSNTRALLGLTGAGSDAKAGKDGGEVVGDIQVTFTPGLGGAQKNGVFENEPQDEESTRQRYIRKEKERKQRRKEKMKVAKSGGDDALADQEAEVVSEDVEMNEQGFDDPFFTNPSANAVAEKKARKAEKQSKAAAKAAQDDEDATKRAELELLMTDDRADDVKHFDMREIEKAEKSKRKKAKHRKDRGAERVEDAFKIETKDPRFGALYESHEYAIDPSNPRFKGTEGMKALLEEGRKKRKRE